MFWRILKAFFPRLAGPPRDARPQAALCSLGQLGEGLVPDRHSSYGLTCGLEHWHAPDRNHSRGALVPRFLMGAIGLDRAKNASASQSHGGHY